MKRAEFKKAVQLAVSDAVVPAYLSEEMDVAVGGCALDTKRRFVTLAQVASLIRGHCLTFAGTWNFSELDDLEALSKRFDLVG